MLAADRMEPAVDGQRSRPPARASRLPTAAREDFERSLGIDLGGVSVSSGLDAATRFAFGAAEKNEVSVAASVARLPRWQQRALLAHETMHVAQQRLGPPYATSEAAEREAVRFAIEDAVTPGVSSPARAARPAEVSHADESVWDWMLGGITAIRRRAIDGMISGLRSGQSHLVAALRTVTPRLDVEYRGAWEGLVSAIDGVTQLLVIILVPVIALAIGFVSGVLSAIVGVVRLVTGLFDLFASWVSQPIDHGRRYRENLEHLAAAITGFVPALRALAVRWEAEFEHADQLHQEAMIAELTGEIEALIAGFAAAGSGASRLPSLVVSAGVPRFAGATAAVGVGAVAISPAPILVGGVAAAQMARIPEAPASTDRPAPTQQRPASTGPPVRNRAQLERATQALEQRVESLRSHPDAPGMANELDAIRQQLRDGHEADASTRITALERRVARAQLTGAHAGLERIYGMSEEVVGSRVIEYVPEAEGPPLELDPTTPHALDATGQRLLAHVRAAIAEFESEGFTEVESRALRRVERGGRSSLRDAFRGSHIDRIAKNAVMDDPELQHVYVTVNFERGADFYDSRTALWYDITTSRAWRQHVVDYGPTQPGRTTIPGFRLPTETLP